jgi:type IV pilus assembly protein PilP
MANSGTLSWSLALLMGLASAGCEETTMAPVGPGLGGGPQGPAAAAAKSDANKASAESAGLRALKDTDFVESEQNRDPFRNYANELKSKVVPVAQRIVLMPNTPVVNMKLIAIISGIDQPRAMIVDEQGIGHVTTRGDFVGRADVVQSGGAENLPVAINWRVDRIREDEVVLAREDPTGPNRPPLIRVIPLHDEQESADGLTASGNEG